MPPLCGWTIKKILPKDLYNEGRLFKKRRYGESNLTVYVVLLTVDVVNFVDVVLEMLMSIVLLMLLLILLLMLLTFLL